LAPGAIFQGFPTMHFVKYPHLRSTQITPSEADHKPPRFIERLKHNWLFAGGARMLALITLALMMEGANAQAI
jgi:hypothetical protein